MFINKEVVSTVPKKEFCITLPFLGHQSICIKSKLKQLFSSAFPACKLKIIFKSGRKICSFFNFKDKISSNVHSLLVYQYTCSSPNATYFGKTKRYFKVRTKEHLGISYKTGKCRKLTNNSGSSSYYYFRAQE